MKIDRDMIERLKGLAESSAVPLAEMSMDGIASALGMSRMTLYRRAGTREDIVAALEEIGIDARREPDVKERVVTATATLLRQRPLAEVTLELIASEAACSLPALYARFGNRVGVLRAVMERHSPLISVREAVASQASTEQADLRHDIRLLYRSVLPRVLGEWPMLRSLLAEVLRDPGGDVDRAFRDWYVPQITAELVPLFTRHIEQGTIRPLPIPILVQTLIGPMALHGASRVVLTKEFGMELPPVEETVDIMTDIFCRAVEPVAPDG